MKTHIVSNVDIPSKGLDEVESLLGFRPTVEQTKKLIKTKWNPYFKQMWGDFNWVRSLFTNDLDVRCFVTSAKQLKARGIRGHIGMYDLTDSDKIHDFYFGMPTRLDKRAKINGFKTNFAWLFCHEYIHGKEKFAGGPDRVHAMEAQGRLKELIKLHQPVSEETKKKVFSLQQEVVSLATRLTNFILIPKTYQQTKKILPLVTRQAQEVIDDMAMLGHPVRIVEGYRTLERQAELYAQGRTKAGNIVTNAKPGESYHNWGVAVDFVFKHEGYNAKEELWTTLGLIIEKHGFSWGGRWKNFPDRPHAELTMGYTINDFQQGKVDYSRYL